MTQQILIDGTDITEMAKRIYRDNFVGMESRFGVTTPSEIADMTVAGIGEHYNVWLAYSIDGEDVTFTLGEAQ